MKRSAMTTLALGAALVVVAAAPASAKNGVDPAKNSPRFWQTDTTVCEKLEMSDGNATVVLPEAPDGGAWALLVIKAGAGAQANAVVTAPEAGVAYGHPSGKDISHVITCLGAGEPGDPGDGDPSDGDPGDGGGIIHN